MSYLLLLKSYAGFKKKVVSIGYCPLKQSLGELNLSRSNCNVSTCSPTTEGVTVITESVEEQYTSSREIREADSPV